MLARDNGVGMMECEEKRRYITNTDALIAGARALRKNGNDAELRAYKCQQCDGWHLTHVSVGQDWRFESITDLQTAKDSAEF